MLITTNRSLPVAVRAPNVRAEVADHSLASAEGSDQFHFSPAAVASPKGSLQWGPIVGVLAGIGATTGLAASGLGAASAVPAFLVGGALGFVVAHEGVNALISNGRDSSGTGPIAAFAGVVGGVGTAIGATALALRHGGPMIGVGAGVTAVALSVGYGLYLRNH